MSQQTTLLLSVNYFIKFKEKIVKYLSTVRKQNLLVKISEKIKLALDYAQNFT